MITSEITKKTYEPSHNCVFLTNVVQVKKYLDLIGPEHLLDIWWTSEKRPDCLVFVWEKCPETAWAKKLWDNREI